MDCSMENINQNQYRSNDLQNPTSEEPIYLNDLFTSEFMQIYTKFDSIEKLLSSGGFEVNSEEDYDAIPDKEIDAFVLKTTNFQSWKEMITEAAKVFTSSH
ncbi:hypothetical protein [Desulfosporosinus sp. SB140]|uniref:hypothetical protein n=1 Tax=Desulfosporosinus paludis TaxID=3115649 RepID=UPI00388EB01B